MRESLSTALAIPARRRIFALGDMLELGAHAQDAHYALGQHIGRINPELLYLVGDLSQYVKQGALDAGMQAERIFHCESTDEIATSLRYILTDGDVLLVKGSRGMHLEMVVQRLLEED
jgi:UDP-N-acetylmuramoyl-tripeptide--D-alanyl-D-alanine ligase